ncbi:MAG: hypothetical protein R3F02_19110 [Thiolinea sp.]
MHFTGKLLATLLGLSIIYSETTLACTPPARPDVNALNNAPAKMILSGNGKYLLKLIPGKWALEKGRIVKKREAYGLAFELLKNGQLKQIWSYKNWDAHINQLFRYHSTELYLDNDGKKLTEINREVSSASDKTAAVIYYMGRKGARYAPKDFGVTSVRVTTCGTGPWTVTNQTYSNLPEGAIPLQTIAGKTWFIDPRSNRPVPVK